MSTLSQFSGGGIKSIQRGTILVTNISATATITAVDTAKTMLNFCGCSSGRFLPGYSTDVSIMARIALTSSTQITSSQNVSSASGTSTTVSYEVIEYF
jgi:hypothetical protein